MRRIRERGLTLAELLTLLVIIGVLMATASASYEPLVSSVQARSAMSTLRHLVLVTRSEAIKRGNPTVLCPTNDGLQCAPSWGNRVMVISDPERNGIADSASDVVRDLNFLSDHELLAYNRPALVFGPLGRTLGSNGTFVYCRQSRLQSAEGLIVSRLGRLRRAQDHDGDGIREKRPGTPLDCPT